MDIYQQVLNFLSNLPAAQLWPGFQSLLERAVSKRDSNWLLPLAACQAVGGKPEQIIAAAAALACLQISIILIDDLLDDDPRGEQCRIGGPAAANLAVAFQALGLEAIAQCDTDPRSRLDAAQNLSHTAFVTAFGQQWDVQNPADESAYWRVVEAKSAPFFGSALYIGALLGGADTATVNGLYQLGCLYGEMIQLYDDLHDTMAVPANPDWTMGRSPLPILFAQTVQHPMRLRFLELLRLVPNPEALAEAQDILIRCGAISYCVAQLILRYQRARQILVTLPLVYPAGLEALFEEQIQPVREMLAASGDPLPESFTALE